MTINRAGPSSAGLAVRAIINAAHRTAARPDWVSQAVTPGENRAAPFVVRVALDDTELTEVQRPLRQISFWLSASRSEFNPSYGFEVRLTSCRL
jgi:hypothetical protein